MGEPQKTFTEADFKTAVAAAADEAVARVLESLQAGRKAAGTSDDGNDASWVARLASELAQLNNQGPNAKLYVAPEIMAQRKLKREEMTVLIVESRARGDHPRYALRNKVYLNERLIDPIWVGADHLQHRTEIEWSGVPSEAMIPLNEAAKEIYGAFSASIGSKTPFTDDRLLAVTAAGLVVHGAPQKRRDTGLRQPGDRSADFGDDLAIPHRDGMGDGAPLHVLGTVAPPARQNLNARQSG